MRAALPPTPPAAPAAALRVRMLRTLLLNFEYYKPKKHILVFFY